MTISLCFVAEGNREKYGKPNDYEVLGILNQTPMPEGCVTVTTTPITDEEAGIHAVQSITEIKSVLYHAFFKVIARDMARIADTKDAKLVEVYGVLDEESKGIHWVEAADTQIINYKQYVANCNLLDVAPKSFIQYWLHVTMDYGTFSPVKVPDIEPGEVPTWFKEDPSSVDD